MMKRRSLPRINLPFFEIWFSICTVLVTHYYSSTNKTHELTMCGILYFHYFISSRNSDFLGIFTWKHLIDISFLLIYNKGGCKSYLIKSLLITYSIANFRYITSPNFPHYIFCGLSARNILFYSFIIIVCTKFLYEYYVIY